MEKEFIIGLNFYFVVFIWSIVGQIMSFKLNNKIKVGVVFKEKSADMVPKWFIRQGRRYLVDRVNYTWDEKKGRSTIRHFAVTAEKTNYELTYDTQRMAWRLVNIDDES